MQILRNAKKLITRFRMAIVFGLEPGISELEVDDICHRLGRSNWVFSDVEGFSGVLWVQWNKADIFIKVIHVDKFFLHILINEGKSSTWELTLSMPVQSIIWGLQFGLELAPSDIIHLGHSWVISIILCVRVKKYFRWIVSQFCTWVHQVGLIDAAFIGPIYPWNHGKEIGHRRSARLDRLLRDDA